MWYRLIRFIKHLPYSIKYGFINLWKWLPVIWKDRDWDQHFLYTVLHFKLKNMEKLHRNYAHYVGSEKEADNIKRCVLLLERILDDVYYGKVFREHEKKWGGLIIGQSNTYDGSVISREKITNKEEDEQETKEAKKLYDREEDLRNQDIKYLFYLLGKHVEKWWD